MNGSCAGNAAHHVKELCQVQTRIGHRYGLVGDREQIRLGM